MSIDQPIPPAADRAPGREIDLTASEVGDERETIGELVAATTRDLSELMRKEVELAKTELKEEAVAAGRAGAMVGAGGLLGYLGLLILLLAVSWGLAEVLPTWVAFAIVGVVVAVVAAVLIQAGRTRLSAIEAAPNTIETLQEDVQWAKQQLS